MRNNYFFEEIIPFKEILDRHHYCLPENYCEKGIRFFATTSPEFRKRYSHFHLTKILNAFCTLEAKISAEKANKELLFRLLKTDSPENFALGVAVVIKCESKTEFLSKERLLQAILHIIPGVTSVPHASYHYRDEITGLLFLYEEIEKKRGRGFTQAEIILLKHSLLKELEESVESYSPSLFLIRNEEEMFRNIIQMGRELTSVDDLPQVTISFQEQRKGFLRFSVVVVRIVDKTSPSLRELSRNLPQTIHFIPELASQIGTLDKEHAKQGNILTFEVEGTLFSRKKGSIDLREARSYIAKALELMIGEFRDYNGGLLSKQKQLFVEIEKMLGEENTFFLKSIFYSLTPSNFQSFILPEAVRACASLFLQYKNRGFPTQNNAVHYRHDEKNFSLALVCTSNNDLNEALLSAAANFEAPLHQFGYASQSIHGEHYIWFVYQYPTEPTWFNVFEQVVMNFRAMPKHENNVLRINFQDGDPLSLNPHIGLDLRCRSLQKALFEGLTRLGPFGSVELAAAEKITLSEDEKTYFFTLRKHQWSNGDEVTAYHFEKTWRKAIFSPSSLRPDIFFIIQNARLARQGRADASEVGVTALNKRTLKVNLEYPAPHFLQLLAHPLFFPLYEEHGEPYTFNGPFTLNSWKRENHLTLIKNPYYWDFEHVKLEGVDISIIRDSELAIQKYDKGGLDWVGGPFSLMPPAICNARKELLQRADTLGVAWLYCNLGHSLLSSSLIRQALARSLDRNKICLKTFNRFPIKTHIPKKLSQLNECEIYGAPDEQKALELFAEGLKLSKFSRGRLPRLTLFYSHIAGQKELAIEVQRQWQELFGLQITAVEETWNTFSHQLDNRLIHFGSCYRHPFYKDCRYFFDLFYEPTNIHNAFGWHDNSFEQAINRARQFPHETQHLKEAERILLAQMPVIPIHCVSYHYLAREQVKGIYFSHSGDVDFKWIHF